MAKKSQPKKASADVRIKEAAHKIFLAKGFAAATVRDVAKEASVNVALVNYYFGSKKKLFDAVMMEKIKELFGTVMPIFVNEKTSLNQKIDEMVNAYVDFLAKNPDLPAFIVSETWKQNVNVISTFGASIATIRQSPFIRQLQIASGKNDALQLMLSLAGMVIFPFIVKPSFIQSGAADEKTFDMMMQARKKVIPVWMKAILANEKK